MIVVVALPRSYRSTIKQFKPFEQSWIQKEARCLGAPPKNMMDRISICEALVKRNEIDPFLKRMGTGNEKWVTYDNIVRKRSRSKRGDAAQTVAKPGLSSRKVLLCIWWD
ncbi:mariner transposase [Trichonephila clavipes]|nr:mariner transposase [Trichonephila clavipes]